MSLPLRERIEDIPQLTDFILEKLGKTNGGNIPRVHPDTLTTLQSYTFPGNGRELENILERALTLCEGQIILPDDLQLPQNETQAQENLQAPKFDVAKLPHPVLNDSISLEDQLGNIEKEAILKALEKTRYNKTAAAKLLGMSFRSLRYRLKKLDLE